MVGFKIQPEAGVSISTSTIVSAGTWATRHRKNVEERPTLINRTWLDVAQYRDHAKNLGYDGEGLERLVVQWRALLDKAKCGTLSSVRQAKERPVDSKLGQMWRKSDMRADDPAISAGSLYANAICQVHNDKRAALLLRV